MTTSDMDVIDSMVSSNTAEEGDVPATSNGLPPGNYCLVSWDLDTTGSRLVDEICQIGAYTPTSTFSQYVMPYRDLTQAARRRYNIRIITIGRFRMLKDIKRGKVLKTKSEISALVDFIHWLEDQKGSKDGVILLKHENRKITTPLLLEALGKYNLMDDFRRIVVGFADGYSYAENRCAKTVRYFSLRTLARILLHRDEEELDRASNRACAIYQVALNIAGLEGSDTTKESGLVSEDLGVLIDSLRQFTSSVDAEEKELQTLKATVVRQDSFRPIFANMLGPNSRERQRAFNLRTILVEAGLDYSSVQEAYEKGGAEGVKKLILEVAPAKTKDLEDIHRLMMEHFAPEDYPRLPTENSNKTPNRRVNTGRRVRVKSESKNKNMSNGDVNKEPVKEIGAGDALSDTTLDTTASTPSKLVSSSRSDGSSPQSGDNEVSSAESSGR